MITAQSTVHNPTMNVHTDPEDRISYRVYTREDGSRNFSVLRAGGVGIFISKDQALSIMTQIAQTHGLTVEREPDESTIAEGDELARNELQVPEVS